MNNWLNLSDSNFPYKIVYLVWTSLLPINSELLEGIICQGYLCTCYIQIIILGGIINCYQIVGCLSLEKLNWESQQGRDLTT